MSASSLAGGGARTYTLLDARGQAYSSSTPGSWGGHRGTKVYGRLDCASARRAIAVGGYVAHRVFFDSEATALAAGFRPCGTCCRTRHRAWKDSVTGAPPEPIAPVAPRPGGGRT